jgi:hypothetical protein
LVQQMAILRTRRAGVGVLVGSRTFSFQTASGIRPASFPMGTKDSFPGLKRPEREADHSPPTSAEVKKTWISTSTPTYHLHGIMLN